MRPPRRLRGRTPEEEDVGSSTPQPAENGPRGAYQPTQNTRERNHVKTHQHLTGPYIAKTAPRQRRLAESLKSGQSDDHGWLCERMLYVSGSSEIRRSSTAPKTRLPI